MPETKNTTYYLFVFLDGSLYEMTNAVSFKDAIWEMAKHECISNEMFRKGLEGYESDDINGLIEFFNHVSYLTTPFVYRSIYNVYEISRKIYDGKER